MGAHQELWLLAGGSPLAALGVAWWAGRGRRRPVPRRSLLTRAGLLLAACTLAAIPVESYALSRLAALLPAADPSAGYVVVSLVGAVVAVVVTLAFVIVIRWGNPRSAPPRTYYAGRAPVPTTSRRPEPGEVWWATVPFKMGEGEKHRPCVVVRCFTDHAQVLQITSQDKSWNSDHIPLSRDGWGASADKDSWLEIGVTRDVLYGKFDRPAGHCPRTAWQMIVKRYPPVSAPRASRPSQSPPNLAASSSPDRDAHGRALDVTRAGRLPHRRAAPAARKTRGGP